MVQQHFAEGAWLNSAEPAVQTQLGAMFVIVV